MSCVFFSGRKPCAIQRNGYNEAQQGYSPASQEGLTP